MRHPAAVDWEAVRERIARVAEATEAARRHAPEAARVLMDARARRFAHAPAAKASTGVELQVLRFEIGPERFAIETRYVHEVLKVGALTRLPGGADVLLGLTNLCGELLGVMDLAHLVGYAPLETTPRSRIVTLGEHAPEVGALVDAVYDVVALPGTALLDSPNSGDLVARKHVRAVTADGVSLLDGAALLTDPRLFVGEEGQDGPEGAR